MSPTDRIARAGQLYERAVFGGDASVLTTAERDLDAVEADLALARGRIMHARFLAERTADPRELAWFERAAELYQQLGDVRGEAEARFWIGAFHQVVRDDHETALPALEQSRDLAVRADDPLTLSYALRHLAFVEHIAGRPEAARERMAESLRLRRELGFLPGVAANLVGLAYLAAEQGRREEALKLLDEADEAAVAGDAHGIRRQIEAARTQVDSVSR